MTQTFKELRITPALIEFDDDRIVNVKTISEVRLGPDWGRCVLRLLALSLAMNLLGFGVGIMLALLSQYADGSLSTLVTRILSVAVGGVAIALAIGMTLDWVRSLLAVFRLFGVVELKWPAFISGLLVLMTFIMGVLGAALPIGVGAISLIDRSLGSGGSVFAALATSVPSAVAVVLSMLLYRFALRYNVLALLVTSPFPAGVSIVSPKSPSSNFLNHANRL